MLELIARAKQSLLRRFWPVLKLVNIGFTDKILNSRFKFLPRERISELAYRHFHERTELRIAMRLIGPGGIVLDVGANIGLYTCIAAKQCGNEGMVIAIEPNDQVLPRLIENLYANSINNVCVLSVGVSDTNGVGEIRRQDRNMNAFSSMAPLPQSGDWETVKIPTMTIDTIWREVCNRRSVVFVKVDVEGWEEHVFRGASEFLRSGSSPIIQFEHNREAYLAADSSLQSILELLAENDYRVFRILHESKEELCREVNADYDPGCTENLYAVLKGSEAEFESALRFVVHDGY